MSDGETSGRAFRVRARHLEAHYGRLVSEASFEAAAIAYVEDFAPSSVAEAQISVLVCDVESGHEHCFWVDLETGQTAPCA